MTKSNNFNDIKKELDEVIAWFESEDISIEDAPKQYKRAKMLLDKMENILKETELEIKKLK